MIKGKFSNRLLAGVAIFSLGLLTACNPPTSSATASADLPESHDELVQLAQEEGTVRLGAGGHTQAQAQLLADKFEDAYGIKVEFIRENSGQIAQKLEAQLSGGNVSFDVVSVNDASTMEGWVEDGTIADAALPNGDGLMAALALEDASFYPFTWAALGYSYNSATMDKSEAPTTWEELAAADGNKAVADPGSSGAALTFAAIMDEVDSSFFPALGQGKVLTSDSALALGQMVATGEATFGIPGIEHDIATAQLAGEPLAMGYPEGRIGAMASYMASLESAAHPAAARLLVQFAMSPEFQTAQTEIGSRSTLSDIPAPSRAEEIASERIVVVDHEKLATNRDDIIQNFEKAVR